MSRTTPILPPPGARPRVHYIDWLRVLAVLLLFPYHVSRVFNEGEAFYVKGALSESLNAALGFISVWHMPLLFFLAGASTFFALGRRGGGGYLFERTKRLLLPLAFGFLVLIPPQTWYGGRFNSGYEGSFWHYLTSGDWLVYNIRDGGDYFGGFGLGHLWFIMVLFMLSVIVLPLLVWGRTERGGRRTARLSRFLSRPRGWLLAALLLFFADALPELEVRPFYYLAVFLLGYLAFVSPGFEAAAVRFRRAALATGVGLSLLWVFTDELRNSLPDPSLQRAGLVVLGFLATWLMIVGFVGYGRQYLDRRSAALSYLAEGSYPIYLLHQTVIVVLAFYLVDLVGGGTAQWFALLVSSVLATFAIYEAVRRLPIRVLMGMRLARPTRRSAETPLAGAASIATDAVDVGAQLQQRA